MTILRQFFNFLFLDFFFVGSPDEKVNGCPRYDWVSLEDQKSENGSYPVPVGFTRPNTVSFPVFTFENENELFINCQILLCVNDSPNCNIDFANCLQLNQNDKLERKRRSLSENGGQTVNIKYRF